MIQHIENYLSQQEIDAILATLTLSPEVYKESEHPNELGDYAAPNIPEELKAVMSKLFLDGYFPVEPDAINVHEYMPGQSFDAHIDDVSYGETVAVVSITGECDMVFSREGETDNSYHLSPRSLIVWNGDERWNWKHSIPKVETRRVSLVIRKQR